MGRRPVDKEVHLLGAALDAASTPVQRESDSEIAPQIFSGPVPEAEPVPEDEYDGPFDPRPWWWPFSTWRAGI